MRWMKVSDYVRSNHCLHIGEYSAEAIKKELGAVVNDPAQQQSENEMEVVGKLLLDGSAAAIKIGAHEVREALEPILADIVTGIKRIIEDAQPEAVADIYYSGLILTGGGSLLKGMKERLQSELKLHVSVPEDPISAVVIGAGTLLSRPDVLYRSSIRQNLPVWQASEELVVSW